MVALELRGVEIDYCVRCRGTWLDVGELELLDNLAGVAYGGLSRTLTGARGKQHGRRRCPRCSRRLELIHVGGDESVELDRCPAGQGLWFDHGEMDAFMATFSAGEEGAAARFFADLYGKQPPHLATDADGKET